MTWQDEEAMTPSPNEPVASEPKVLWSSDGQIGSYIWRVVDSPRIGPSLEKDLPNRQPNVWMGISACDAGVVVARLAAECAALKADVGFLCSMVRSGERPCPCEHCKRLGLTP